MNDLGKLDELVFGKKRKAPRSRAGRKEIKQFFGNKCQICGKSEKQVGELQIAHYKARSKGGSFKFPLCPNCHRKYDKGLLTKRELKKINLTPEQYKKFLPKKRKAKKQNDIFNLTKIRF